MVYYSIDSNTRTKTYSSIAILSVFLNYTMTPYVAVINKALGVSLNVPTSFFVFGLLVWLYENYLWSWTPFSIRLSRIPRFSGDWPGYIVRRTEYRHNGDHFVEVTHEMDAIQLHIRQTYSKIILDLRSMATDHSIRGQESTCTSASVLCDNRDQPRIIYTWRRRELNGEAELISKSQDNRSILEGNYSSNHPRLGFIQATRMKKGENWYCGKLVEMTSSTRRKYVGIHIPAETIQLGLTEMRSLLSVDQYNLYVDNRMKRDGVAYHITVFDPSEYEKIDKASLGGLVGRNNLWVDFVGLGRQTRNNDDVIYYIALCSAAQTLRNKCGLGNKDFHVTLGFKREDIHDVSKGIETLLTKRKWW